MRSRLEGGPYDGYDGHPSWGFAPKLIGVGPCPGCGCGRDLHASLIPRAGEEVYRLVSLEDNAALYRHEGENLNPTGPYLVAEEICA